MTTASCSSNTVTEPETTVAQMPTRRPNVVEVSLSDDACFRFEAVESLQMGTFLLHAGIVEARSPGDIVVYRNGAYVGDFSGVHVVCPDTTVNVVANGNETVVVLSKKSFDARYRRELNALQTMVARHFRLDPSESRVTKWFGILWAVDGGSALTPSHAVHAARGEIKLKGTPGSYVVMADRRRSLDGVELCDKFD